MNSKRIVFLLLAVIVAGTTAFVARALAAIRARGDRRLYRRAAPAGRGRSPRCRCWWRRTPSAPTARQARRSALEPGRRATCRRPISSKASGRSATSCAVARVSVHVGAPIVESGIVMPGSRGFWLRSDKPGLRAVSVLVRRPPTVGLHLRRRSRRRPADPRADQQRRPAAQRHRDDPAQCARSRWTRSSTSCSATSPTSPRPLYQLELTAEQTEIVTLRRRWPVAGAAQPAGSGDEERTSLAATMTPNSATATPTTAR